MAFVNNACNIGTAGVVVFDGMALFYGRTLTAGSSKLSISNGSGVSGNPTLDVVPGNISINTLGSTPLTVANGGTGITTTPANGQIPIGNGTNYTAATLTAGSNITITNGSGSITIAATVPGGGVTSLTGTAHQVLCNGTSGSPTIGAITLTLPQNIDTNASVTFNSATISNALYLPGLTTGSVLFAGASAQVIQDNAKFFWDDANFRLGIGTDTPAFDLQVVGGVGFKYRHVTTTATVAITDNIIGADSTGGAFIISLPSSAPAAGWFCSIKDEGGDAATNNITISGNGLDIDGSSSITINQAYGEINFYSNGSNYFAF